MATVTVSMTTNNGRDQHSHGARSCKGAYQVQTNLARIARDCCGAALRLALLMT
jgi:hypothetical protein